MISRAIWFLMRRKKEGGFVGDLRALRGIRTIGVERRGRRRMRKLKESDYSLGCLFFHFLALLRL
jgi:hypothetical protein